MAPPATDPRLALVESSPERVAAHDRAGWLALFSTDAEVADPVGIRPHRGVEALGRFYDTFIGPNDIRFDVHADIMAGEEVVRDVTIHIRFPSGASVTVPAYLRYELCREAGVLKLRRLEAHWQMKEQVSQLLAGGWAGMRASMGTSAAMLKNQGMGSLVDYVRAMGGIGRRGHAAAAQLADSVTRRAAREIAGIFASDAQVEWPIGTMLSPKEWLEAFPVHAAMTMSSPLSAGMSTGFRFSVSRGEDRDTRGIGILSFDSRSKKIASARFFLA